MAKSIIKRDFDFKSKLRGMRTEVDRPVVGYATGGLLSNYAENKEIPEVQQAMGLRGTLAARNAELANPEAGRPPVMPAAAPRPMLPSVPNLTNQDLAGLGLNPMGGSQPSFGGALRDRLRIFGPSGFADGGMAEAPMKDVFTKRTRLLDDPGAQPDAPPLMAPERPALPSVPNLSNEQLASLGKNPMGTAAPTFFGALKDRWGGASGYGKGGKVAGPGGPTDDKVPALLSDGEYVLPAKTVKKVGVDKLDKLVMKTNHKKPVHLQKKKGLRKFESGGMLDDIIGRVKKGIGAMNPLGGAAVGAYDAATAAKNYATPATVPPNIEPVKKTDTDFGKKLTSQIADVSGETERALTDGYKIAAERVEAPNAPGLTPQNLRRFNSFERIQNPLSGVHGSSFMGSLFQGAINRGDETAKSANNRMELANAAAQSQAIAAENASKNTRFGTQMQGFGTNVQQRGQDLLADTRSKELEIQDRFNRGQLANQRMQREFQAMQYRREQEAAAVKAAEERAKADATKLDKPLVGKPTEYTDPEDFRRRRDHYLASFPAAGSGTVSPLDANAMRTAAAASYDLRKQATQPNVNFPGRVGQTLGVTPRLPDYVQSVETPIPTQKPTAPSWVEPILYGNIKFGGGPVVRDERGAPIQVGANTDEARAAKRAQVVGYECGGLVKKRGLRRG